MERTCAFALEIQDIWQFYTEAYNVGFLFLFALAWHSVSFLFGFRSPFFSPLSLLVRILSEFVSAQHKAFAEMNICFGFRIWIYKRFSGNESFEIDKTTIGTHTRRRRSREKESEWLRFSINSINVQFFFGLLCVMLYFIPFARTMLLRIPNASCVFDTQLNKKSEPELQRFIRLSIVLSKCETTAHKIQTICIVLNATISFIYHWFFLSSFSPVFCRLFASFGVRFHFRNDLVTEHGKCFHIRSTTTNMLYKCSPVSGLKQRLRYLHDSSENCWAPDKKTDNRQHIRK